MPTFISHASRRSRKGFTIIELMITVSVFTLVVAGALSGMLLMVRSEARQIVQIALDAEGQRVAAFLRNSLRLSRRDAVRFFPEDDAPIAMSYPVPARPHADGSVDLDADGRPVWGETIIVHGWPTNTPTELRLTRFSPRDPSLTDAQRSAKLQQVVADGHGINTFGGSNSTTRTLARLGPQFRIAKDASVYDFYAPTPRRDPAVTLGGVRLQPGNNTLRFCAVGRHPESAGFGIRLDQLRLSPAGLPIEAEALLPTVVQSGAVVTEYENVASSWSDRRGLSFPASGSNDWFEISFFNDTWHETLFHGPGTVFDDAVTVLSSAPGDVGIRLQPHGGDLTWSAELQTGSAGTGEQSQTWRGRAVRVIVRGRAAAHGQHILAHGDGCTVTFRASDLPGSHFRIEEAWIAEALDHTHPTADLNAETLTAIQFTHSGGQIRNWVMLMFKDRATSNPVNLEIDPEKSYVITYRISASGAGMVGFPWVWNFADGTTNRMDSYWIPAASSADTLQEDWLSRDDVSPEPFVVAVEFLQTTFANRAEYISRIIDTQRVQPDYLDLNWNADTPAGSTVELWLRTGNQPNLSDASDWISAARFLIPGPVTSEAGNGRFAQVRVVLEKALDDPPPALRHFTLRWLGEPATVDLSGIFGQFPEGGRTEITVNGEPPVSALRVELTLNAGGPSMGKTGRAALSSSIRLETTPRN